MVDRPEQRVYRRGQGHNRPRPPPSTSNHHGDHHHHPSNCVRVLDNLGVKDLREHLERKRVERRTNNEDIDASSSPPPPDPTYNYLKDPTREKSENPAKHNHKKATTVLKNEFPDSHRHQGHHNNQQQHQQDIVNPPNIKVQFSTSTGEHIYTLDQDNILPTIEHVPDRNFRFNYRRRGRGRGHGRGRLPRKPNRSKSEGDKNGNEVNNDQDEVIELQGDPPASTSQVLSSVVDDANEHKLI